MTELPQPHAQDTLPKVSPEATMLDADLRQWNERTEALMGQGARIITFRGAGTVNGIEPGAAEAATATLQEYVKSITDEGTPVVLMYDGDEDNREKPDVGSVFGGLVDSLADNPKVTAIAAQTKGWYYPRTEGGPIESASGKPYETYVFPDDTPGSHASLTQSDKLVGYAGYEQVFVGPAGPIAFNQLKDLSDKTAQRPAEMGEVPVTILVTPNNPGVGEALSAQLATTTDEQAREKIAAKLTQREQQPYGALCMPTGEFAVDPTQYPGIKLTVAAVNA